MDSVCGKMDDDMRISKIEEFERLIQFNDTD